MPGGAVSAEQAVGGTTPHAAGHHEQMALVAHAPNTYTQAQEASPQDPERRGHATRQYTVKVSLLTSAVPHPVHTAPWHAWKRAASRKPRDGKGDVWLPAMPRRSGSQS